jgi:hypothetical protein
MGTLKYKANTNYKDIIDSDRGGIAVGLDAFVFLRENPVGAPRTFTAPRVGTQTKWDGAVSGSTDISAGSNDTIRIQVDIDPATGLLNTAVDAVLTLAGLTTGAAIEAELETKINAALAAAGQDGRVWVDFVGAAPDQYTIYSQKTGVNSRVVVGTAPSDDVAPDLNLDAGSGGAETVGADDQDFLLHTVGGLSYNQPNESNAHRSGRYHSGIVRKKKVGEFDLDTNVNLGPDAGDSIDEAKRLLYKSVFGSEEVVVSTLIKYVQGLPNTFFSAVQVGTIHAEYHTGGYAKDWTLTINGDAQPSEKFTGRTEKSSISGIAKVDGVVAASDTVVTDAGHTRRFQNNGTNNPARVMVVGADGVTITAGQDGSLTMVSKTDGTNTMVLSTTVDVEDDGYIVPWHPGAVQQTGTDNIQTDLEGSFKFNSTGNEICITGLTLGYVNNHVDFDNCFGSDGNLGFAAANRATITLSVTFDLSNENLGDVVDARDFNGFSPVIEIGPDPDSGRKVTISATKWTPSVPALTLPENGTVPVTMEGILYQSTPGARNPVSMIAD